MNYHMQHRHRATLMANANPDCDECSGFGVVTFQSVQDGSERDMPCVCTKRYDEPADDPYAWSGGFAENH